MASPKMLPGGDKTPKCSDEGRLGPGQSGCDVMASALQGCGVNLPSPAYMVQCYFTELALINIYIYIKYIYIYISGGTYNIILIS